jgi:YVTN family beta-propeller protein
VTFAIFLIIIPYQITVQPSSSLSSSQQQPVLQDKSIDISTSTNEQVKLDIHEIEVGDYPSGIAVDPFTNKVYVANSGSDSISVIDGSTDKVVANITEGVGDITGMSSIKALAVGSISKRADVYSLLYVPDNIKNTISVINSLTNKIENNITEVVVGISDSSFSTSLSTMYGIDINPETNRVYVVNEGSDSVSVIDTLTNKIVDYITEGINEPYDIAINSETNRVYVVNRASDSVFVIDGSINKVVVGITFSINPSNSGHIKCNNENIATNQYTRIGLDTECTAVPNKGFEFSNWVENLGNNSTKTISTVAKSNFWYTPIIDWLKSFADTIGWKTDNYDSATFTVTRYGTFIANFEEVPPPLPPEYWATIFGVVVSSIVGSWFVPGIISWTKSKSHVIRFYGYHKQIHYLYSDGKLDLDDIKSLDELNRDIEDDYARGKITDHHYTNLKNEISLLYQEIFKKRIDSLHGKNTNDDNITRSLIEIKEDLEDFYAKGKLNELHYDVLNKKISDYENSQFNK